MTVSSNCLNGNNISTTNQVDTTSRVTTNGNCHGNSNDIAITANFTPCRNNGGRTGFVRGCYRRIR